MNDTDLVELLELIDAYSPGFGSKDRQKVVFAVWAVQMQEIPTRVATDAVHTYYATESRWITPADVRRYGAASAGVLPPDTATAQTQAIELWNWYQRARPGCQPDPDSRPKIHPATEATIKAVGGIENAININRYDWRDAYRAQVAAFEQRALAPGGILTARREVTALPPAPRPALEAVPDPEDAETFERAAELRAARGDSTARLDQVIAELGDDARWLLPRNARIESRFGQAALRHKLRDYGAEQDPDEALRIARLEIARHPGSGEAVSSEATKQAALRALESMMAAQQ
ncbi:hypothetical protein MXD62_19635 [Frankia sp. Mgl5]|uniref:hypothetical protein n=1 Tax=Frankia sp. Mgl5 TaxID=2933793 RepID=UPI00200E51F0|nr:hypothetical protein [Frankia sp. Mgl5]MCK9929365.1 hypothetical protein [Frankia sp. Mgl5]